MLSDTADLVSGLPLTALATSYTVMSVERELTHLHVEAGPAGWVTAYWRRGARSREQVARVRFEPLTNGWWRPEDVFVSASVLDDVPLRKIELAVNATEVVPETLEEWLDKPSPVDFPGAVQAALEPVLPTRLKRPRGRKLDDDFYREVAFAYRDAVRRGSNPAKTMAADAKKPVSTVNRWIGRTRELGYLPPTEPGRVSV
jgi:hypothetical protein